MTTTLRVRKGRARKPAHDAEPSWHIKLEEGISTATRLADSTGLPQTVYKTADTCGWTNTCFISRVLAQPETQVHLTVLPARYFS